MAIWKQTIYDVLWACRFEISFKGLKEMKNVACLFLLKSCMGVRGLIHQYGDPWHETFENHFFKSRKYHQNKPQSMALQVIISFHTYSLILSMLVLNESILYIWNKLFYLCIFNFLKNVYIILSSVALLAVTVLGYIASFATIVLLFVFYTQPEGCLINKFFISFNLLLCIGASVISVMPKVQVRHRNCYCNVIVICEFKYLLNVNGFILSGLLKSWAV